MEVFIIKNTSKGIITNLALDRIERVSETTDLTTIETQLARKWDLSGNAGTNPTTDFIGTTDAQDLSIRTNNTERVLINSFGTLDVRSNNLRVTNTTNGGILGFVGGTSARIDATTNLAMFIGGKLDVFTNGVYRFAISSIGLVSVSDNGGTSFISYGNARFVKALQLDVNAISFANNTLRNNGTDIIYKDNLGVEYALAKEDSSWSAWEDLTLLGDATSSNLRIRRKGKLRVIEGLFLTPNTTQAVATLNIIDRPFIDVTGVGIDAGENARAITIGTSGNIQVVQSVVAFNFTIFYHVL